VPFVKKSFHLKEPIKAFLFIIRQFNFTQGEAQRLISKGRILINTESIYDRAATIYGDIEVIYFEPKSRDIYPLFFNKDFLIYDKPSGVLVHPNTMATEYSMLDEIRSHSGQNANNVHRIDLETSGLLLASRHKSAEKYLKGSFEKKKIKKKYLAWVDGKVTEPFEVEEPISIRNDYSKNKHKVEISENGKYAKTEFTALEYNKELNSTLLECRPLTGRTHQIRIHLFHVKHPILGDPIYGTSFAASNKYLEGNLNEKDRFIQTGATRLLLHANSLEFPYACTYKIVSKINFQDTKNLICPKEERKFNFIFHPPT